jgi:RHS repeat-associated protein
VNHPNPISSTPKTKYPFGMHMPGRTFSTGSYRYGFQGQEKDDEIKGDGNSINYKYRIHDPRLGRFLSVDPLARDYPQWSAYVFSGNQIIAARELEGLEPIWVQNLGNWFRNLPDQGPFQNQKLNKHFNENIYGPDNQKRILNSKEFKIARDITIIGGGIIAIAASGGTATPAVMAAFGIVSGATAFAGGSTKLVLDIKGEYELSDKIPTSFTEATVGLVLKYSFEGRQYEEEVNVAVDILKISEDMLSFKVDLKKLNELPTDIEAIQITVKSINYLLYIADSNLESSSSENEATSQQEVLNEDN